MRSRALHRPNTLSLKPQPMVSRAPKQYGLALRKTHTFAESHPTQKPRHVPRATRFGCEEMGPRIRKRRFSRFSRSTVL